jgi:hypothetical protein
MAKDNAMVFRFQPVMSDGTTVRVRGGILDGADSGAERCLTGAVSTYQYESARRNRAEQKGVIM